MIRIENIGLVLEGGGLRGVYTAGVLDFFIEKGLYFPYTIGVSAGACNGVSYVSKQKERSKRININYIKDKRYLSYRNLIKEKSIFGIDFVYNEIPNKLEPFDYDTFFKCSEEFVIGTTDCVTGKPVYYKKGDYNTNKEELVTIIRASSSLPFVAPIVCYKNMSLLDGGISDPIPVKKSIEDGNSKNIIVLTRNSGYRKGPYKMGWIAKRAYSKHPGLVESMNNRHLLYNDTLDFIERLEKEDKAFIMTPSEPVTVGRLEKDPQKLKEFYDLGYKDAEKQYEKILEFIDR